MEGKIRGRNEFKWQGALVEDYNFSKETINFWHTVLALQSFHSLPLNREISLEPVLPNIFA